jgi:hypothetical protein
MKWGGLQDKRDYLKSPHIANSEVRFLWHSGFWDFPRNGLLQFRGNKYWFEICEGQEEDDEYVRYVILELTSEQLAEEEYWHELFRQKVGNHTDYDEKDNRPIGALKPRENWKAFYDEHKHRKPRDYSNNNVVGWFGDVGDRHR